MSERSIFCWSWCCKPEAQGLDDGEWFEPLPSKKSKPRPKNKSAKANEQVARANAEWGKAKEHDAKNPNIKKEANKRWSESKNDFSFRRLTVEDMDNSEDDVNLSRSLPVNKSSFKKGSMGDLDMGSLSDDSVIEETLNEDEEKRTPSNGLNDVVPDLGETSDSGSKSTPEEENLPRRNARKSFFPGKASAGAMKKRMTTFTKVDVSGMTSAGAGAVKKRMTAFSKDLFNKNWDSEDSEDDETDNPITSIAVLGNGYFLAASRLDRVIKMYKQLPFMGDVSSKVEYVREFSEHKSGVTDLRVLDSKGRFLSASMDKTVRLWDSRFDCEEDDDDDSGTKEPLILLATFDNPERWVHTIGVLDEGSYVRPTDDIDKAMLAAVAKKAAFEGATAVQNAAIQREIIECSGTFVTASKNDKNISIWEMTVKDPKEDESTDDVAELSLAHTIKHDAAIESMIVGKDMIVAGDSMGDVILFSYAKKSFVGSKSWTKLCKYTQRSGLATPDAIMRQAIQCLSFLEGNTKFVSGTREGAVRVWDINNSKKAYHEVNKKYAISVKLASSSLSGIQQLPSMKDPNTGKECLSFSVGSTDGRAISMALHPGQRELVMFHSYNHANTLNDHDLPGSDYSINSIAVSQISNDHPVLIVGDGNGAIHCVKPKWSTKNSADC